MSYEEDQLTKTLQRMVKWQYEIDRSRYDLNEWGQKYYDSKHAQSAYHNHHGLNAYLADNIQHTEELQWEVGNARRMVNKKLEEVHDKFRELDEMVASDPQHIVGTHEDLWTKTAKGRATKSIEVLTQYR
ncbi:hypothetical protein EC988_010291, partial [Linderina pennispora]